MNHHWWQMITLMDWSTYLVLDLRKTQVLLEAATQEAAKSSSSLSVVSLSPFLHFHSFSAPSLFLKDQYDSHTYTEPFKVVLLGGLFFLNSSTLSLLTTSIHCRSSPTQFTSSSQLPSPDHPSPSSSPLDAMPANVRITPHVTSHTPQCNALWLRQRNILWRLF